jgi:hypothetical protein
MAADANGIRAGCPEGGDKFIVGLGELLVFDDRPSL